METLTLSSRWLGDGVKEMTSIKISHYNIDSSRGIMLQGSGFITVTNMRSELRRNIPTEEPLKPTQKNILLLEKVHDG